MKNFRLSLWPTIARVLFLALFCSVPKGWATIEGISVDSKNQWSNELPIGPRPTNSSISADGRFVTFSSFADNLVANDTKFFQDVFLRDRTLGTTTRGCLKTCTEEEPELDRGNDEEVSQ